MTTDLDRALIAMRVSRDHGHGAVLNDAEVRALLAEIDRLTCKLDEQAAMIEQLRAERNALGSAIRWALGYDEGDPQFGEQLEQKGAFAWRVELRRRAGTAFAQIEQEQSK